MIYTRKHLSRLSLFLIASVFISATAAGNCQITSSDCGSGQTDTVVVDLKARCMQTSLNGQTKTYTINIGQDGESMTSSGEGSLAPVTTGEKYKATEAGCTPTPNVSAMDAISTGISGNDSVGKWIHMTSSGKATGAKETLGCIAMSPADFCELKKNYKPGKQGASTPGATKIKVCGGGSANVEAKPGQKPTHTGETPAKPQSSQPVKQ